LASIPDYYVVGGQRPINWVIPLAKQRSPDSNRRWCFQSFSGFPALAPVVGPIDKLCYVFCLVLILGACLGSVLQTLCQLVKEV
jgi:hypothetical protein